MALRTVYVAAKRNQQLATIVINRGPTGPAAEFAGGDISADTVNLHTAAFDTTNGGPTTLGEMAWDSVDGTLDIQADGGVKIAVGEDGLIRVRNTSGVTIAKGAPLVYAGTTGASGKLEVGPWEGANVTNVRTFLGFAAGPMANNTDGYAVWFGKIKEIATDGGAELWDDGDILYAIPGASATLSNIAPTSGDYVTAAVVINAGSGTSGSIFVRSSFDANPYVLSLTPTTEPGSPAAGMVYFDSSTNKLRCYDGATWQDCF